MVCRKFKQSQRQASEEEPQSSGQSEPYETIPDHMIYSTLDNRAPSDNKSPYYTEPYAHIVSPQREASEYYNITEEQDTRNPCYGHTQEQPDSNSTIIYDIGYEPAGVMP